MESRLGELAYSGPGSPFCPAQAWPRMHCTPTSLRNLKQAGTFLGLPTPSLHCCVRPSKPQGKLSCTCTMHPTTKSYPGQRPTPQLGSTTHIMHPSERALLRMRLAPAANTRVPCVSCRLSSLGDTHAMREVLELPPAGRGRG